MRIVTDYKHAQQIIVELDAEIERLTAKAASDQLFGEILAKRVDELETLLCTGEYNDRVANTLTLIAEIMALAKGERHE